MLVHNNGVKCEMKQFNLCKEQNLYLNNSSYSLFDMLNMKVLTFNFE